MFRLRTRLALIALCLALGGWSAYSGRFGFAAAYLAAALAFTYGQIRYGSVLGAFRRIKRGDYQGAGEALAEIRWPHRLGRPHRAYYHFVRGLVELRRGEIEVAESSLQRALELGLRTAHDTAVAHVYLAALYADGGRAKPAREHLDRASRLPHKPSLAPQIEQLSEKIDPGPDWAG